MVRGRKRLAGRVRNTETGTGVADVAVSDGVTVVHTDASGAYRLPWDPTRRGTPMVQITVPSGYRTALDDARIPRFFQRLSEGARDVDFALTPDLPSTDARFRFGHLTDVHVDESTAQTAERVSRDFMAVAAEHPATPVTGAPHGSPRFTVLSGDLTNWATPEEFAAFRAAAAASPVPVWPVAGNHDLLGQSVGGPQRRRVRRPPFAEAIDAYRRHVGPEWYSFQYGGAHFVMLDNFRGLSDPDQFTWLERDLAAGAAGRDVIIVAHVPWNIPQTKNWDRAREYLELLADHNARLFLVGHIHANDVTREPFTGALHAATTSVSFGLDHTPRGYRTVDVEPGRVSTSFVAADGGQVRGPEGRPAPGGETDAPAVSPGTPWPMFHADPERTGAVADPVRPPLRRAWSHDCGGTILTASPVVADATVVVGTRDEHMGEHQGVVAVDMGTGERRWHTRTDGPVEASAAIVDGTVLVPEARGPLHALDATTGERRWSWTPQPPKDGHHWMYFSPAVRDETVYQAFVDMAGAGVAALDVATGRELWRTKEPIGRNWIAHGSPALRGDRLVFTTAYSNLVALDARDGALLWETAFDGWTRSMPIFAGELALLACPGDQLVAVAPDGSTAWRHTSTPAVVPAPTTPTPAFVDGVVYAGFHNGRVTALRQNDGGVLWSTDVGGPITASPAIGGDTVVVATEAGRLVLLDRLHGTVRWSTDLGDHLASSPALSGNAVFVASWNGILHALTGTGA
ncbi:PQQ-binding-like beta-propeller repeat protein [Spiractinospora alimapuensis]|uniref:outer membrane protein assembly factor BamB family protein n=1 Tax=Spiractinospora alimapuensis TaxID=2820884 RepID=UPI001F2BEA8D|nr:PQQ-binding-like beta-propeller repeat protein [Spiractinospora alimapuensis]QVQ50750.1 PQQ-binding-like beta-propeller repeat protein [Spiractinospora alimapuensis]